MDSFDILVVILSIMLAIFLMAGIVLLVLFIQITRRIKIIVDKAESVADHVEHVSLFFQKTAGPAAIGKLVANIYETMHSKKAKRKKEEE